MSSLLLSIEIGMLERDLEKGRVGIATALNRLAGMAQLARSLELELEAHRLIEANRAGREFLEAAAGDVLRPQPSVTGNIIRPDFGGARK